ncbi:MAG: Microsomal dipeptidase [Myxococcaceae bacterium]|nr:Microsomal dipeptidase [Myxococcaceae bacterium]
MSTRAQQLGISDAALSLYLDSEVVDLHLDSFIWRRLFGYDLQARHGRGLLDACFYSQADLPRLRDARVGGAVWVITTNPFRSRRGRRDALFQNMERLTRELTARGDVAIARTLADYREARARGAHAAFLGIQGGNALSLALDDFDRPELASLSLVTLLHFTRSRLGAAALPRPLQTGDRRLTSYGADYVRKLNQKRILVDLAHLGRRGFWDAWVAHDKTQPLTLSHAACDAVFPHFRNVSDEQIKAVAGTGGVIGVIFNTAYLGGSLFDGRAERIVDHLAHVVRLVGADHASLGSDFDGAIVPPRDLRTVLELPRLVELMLRRGFQEEDVRKILGGSFLRMLGQLRG